MQPIDHDNAAELHPQQTATRGWIAEMTWSPSGNLLASASAGGVAIWRRTLDSDPVFIKQHDGPVKSVAFAPNGVTLATASADTTVKVWDLRAFSPSMEPLETYTHGESVEQVAVARNGVVVSACADGIVRLLHPSDTHILAGHTDEVTALAINPGDFRVASGSRDHTIKIWDLRDRELVTSIDGHTDWVRRLDFHPRENLLLSSSRDGSARLWDTLRLPDVTETATLWHAGDVRAAAFDATGTMLATGSIEGDITLWSVPDGEKIATLTKHTKPVISLAFHPQNHWLASGGGDNVVCLWGVSG